MSKNTKKTRTNIEWPTSHFTIADVQTKYPSIVNITLRLWMNKAEEDGELVLIGKIKPKIGRPNKVYSKVNPTKELIEAAKLAGVILQSESSIVTAGEVKIQSTGIEQPQTISPQITSTIKAVV